MGMSGNILAIEDLRVVAPHGRIAGVDLGTKTIGVAICDVGRRLASPVRTIMRSRFSKDAAELVADVTRLTATAIVIGLPLNMDGTEGPRSQATRAFVRNMAGHTALPFIFWDERLSTVAVTRTLIEQDFSRAKRALIVDRVAAAYILQGALDRLAMMSRDGSQSPQ